MPGLPKWQKWTDAFWRGPDYFSGGEQRKRIHLASVVGTVWIFGFLRRKLTFPAIFLLPVAGVILLYASFLNYSPVTVLACLIAAFSLTGAAAGFFFRVRGTLERNAAKHVMAGSIFHVRYTFSNTRKSPLFDVLCDPFEWSPKLERQGAVCWARVEAGGTVSGSVSVRALKRGKVRLYRPIAESAFPLGLVKWSCRGETDTLLYVYPRFTPLMDFAAPAGILKQKNGIYPSGQAGDSPVLLGSRDFREGDTVRHLDCFGSARRGAPVVKEFADEKIFSSAVLVDVCPSNTGSRKSRSAALEAELALATALADCLSRRSGLELLSTGERVQFFGGRPDAGRAFEMLAEAEPVRNFDSGKIQKALLPRLGEVSSAAVFLLADTPERRTLLRNLAKKKIALKVFLITENPGQNPVPPEWQAIPPSQILAGKITRL